MSNFGLRYRGRGGHGSSSRPGLLGAAPGAMKSGLLGSAGLLNQPSSRAPAKYHEPQHFEGDRPGSNHGLLGNAPRQWNENPGNFEMSQHRPQHEPDYSYNEQEQYDHGYDNSRGDEYQAPKGMISSRPLPPEIHRIMSNLGLTKADMEELSRLPEKDLSSSNLLQVIQNIRQKKGVVTSRSTNPSRHDPGPSRQNLHDGPRSFGSRDRSSDREALYDPSEPTDDYGGNERYEDQRHYADENRQSDAFSSFKEKWYTDTSKSNDRERNEGQSAGSILRGSRGPVVKPSRWERDDLPPPMQQPHRPSSQPRRSPPSVGRPAPLMQHRISPPPGRASSPPPQRRHSPPHRMSSPPRRMSSPPRMPTLMSQPPRRGGLLGDPLDPSTQELDLLAASINQTRQPPMHQNVFQPPERNFPEQDRFHPRLRSRSPPPLPLLQQPTVPPATTSVLHAQMQAMQVLQSEAMHIQANQPGGRGPPPRGGKGEKKTGFSKQEAETEAAKMRQEQGRVLYLRYKAGGMDVIREEHLVKLSQPFDKVTNILLVAPKNLKTGWYQAFLELGHFDSAAAMCEHFMKRPPTVQGIVVQVQRSKHRDLKLREHQMNRNFDRLLHANGGRKRRPRSLSPAISKKKTQRSSSTERRSFSKEQEKKATTPNKSGSADKRTNQKSMKNNSGKSNSKNANKTGNELSSKEQEVVEKSSGENKEKEDTGSIRQETISKEKEEGTGSSEVKKGTSGSNRIDNEKLEILRENIEQASNMSEALLKIVQQKSTKAIISEILEYLSDSLDQLKEIGKDSA